METYTAVESSTVRNGITVLNAKTGQNVGLIRAYGPIESISVNGNTATVVTEDGKGAVYRLPQGNQISSFRV